MQALYWLIFGVNWSVIDGFPVVAEYIVTTDTRLDIEQARILKNDDN